MKKYNRDKRNTHKINTHNIKIDDTCNSNNSIHIQIRYDTYRHTEYMPVIYHKTRNDKAQRYVKITNTINDIFPDINAPHNAHTHRAIAPYKAFIPTARTYLPPIQEEEYTKPIKDTRTVKCIIMNSKEEMIYVGFMRRTRIVDAHNGTIDITLHRNKRTMKAYERAVDPDRIIHGLTIREIRRHDVEIYYI